MSDLAAKTLVTSKGTIRAGQPIPSDLPKEEKATIKTAGGIAKLPVSPPDDDAKVTAYSDAVTELQAAEDAVSKAKSADDKEAANKRLTEARRVLFSM